MSRQLTKAEQNLVLAKIQELQQQKVAKKVKGLTLTGLQAEDKKAIAQLYALKASLDQKRDETIDRGFLAFVYTTDKPEGTQIDATEISSLATALMDMDFDEKAERFGQFYMEVDDPDKLAEMTQAKLYMVEEVRKAHNGKGKRKEELFRQAKVIEKAFDTSVAALEEELGQQDSIIAKAEAERDKAQQELAKRRAEFATLRNPATRSQTMTQNGNTQEVATGIDTPEQYEKKRKDALDEIAAAEAVLAQAKAQLDTEMSKRDGIIARKKDLIAQKRAVMNQIFRELAEKGIGYNGVESRETPEGQTQAESDRNNGQEEQAQGGQPLTRRQERAAQKRQAAYKAEDIIHGVNELSDAKLLDHIGRGELGTIIDAKSKIKIGAERREFDMKITSLLEREAGKIQTDPSKPQTTIKIGGVDYTYDSTTRIIKGPGDIEITLSGSRAPGAQLNAEEAREVRNILEELLSKDPSKLTDEERHLSNALQLLVLRNTKRMQFIKGLAAIPGFRGLLRGAVERNNAGLDIADRTSKIINRRKIGRSFTQEIRVADGRDGGSSDRESDPATIHYDGKDRVSRVGNSSSLEDQER
ncbi:MAG: hypothetical protein IKP28_06705 [Clostridia bacterium]|nr:hypothetical protein [Clostridia bacterium]